VVRVEYGSARSYEQKAGKEGGGIGLWTGGDIYSVDICILYRCDIRCSAPMSARMLL